MQATANCSVQMPRLDRLIAAEVATSGLLRRHAGQTAILREVWRQSFFLVGYFLKMLATLLSAMER